MHRVARVLLTCFVAALALVSTRSTAGTPAAPADTASQGQQGHSTTGARPGTKAFMDVLMAADSALKARGGSHAEHARLFLSWNRPWGMPGATTSLMPDLANPAAQDTLYLCFRPGRDTRTFSGFTAKLLFRPQGGDTLGAFWNFGRAGVNTTGIAVQFGPDPSFPMPMPWRVIGTGRPIMERTSSGLRLLMVYAVPYSEAGPVDSAKTYCLARVIIRHDMVALAGSHQPVCIEWEQASLAFALKDEPEVRQGERFVAWNSPEGAVCKPYRVPARTPAWTPGKSRRP